jgi:hypothetical protein
VQQLTEHFSDVELGVDKTPWAVPNAIYICQQLLEPIRAKFGPVRVHDGYRNLTHNAAVGGKELSFHLYEGGQAAADADAPATSIPQLFDWVRLESGLPFDKVILEYDGDLPACVHLQIDRDKPPRRLAYTGSTGAGTVYTPAEVL